MSLSKEQFWHRVGFVKAIFAWTIIMFAIFSPALAAPTEPDKWLVNYEVPEDVKVVTITLSYHWWDPKIDGDVSSEKVLLTKRVKLPPGQAVVPIQILLTGAQSMMVIEKESSKGKGYALGASFARATEPKTNYDGYYVLAQQAVDPKKPAAMGDVQEAVAWIELGIDTRP